MLHFVATFLDPSLRDFLFVTYYNDRDGFFKQAKESIISLVREPHQAKPNDNQPSTMGVSASATLSTLVSDSAQSSKPARKKHKTNHLTGSKLHLHLHLQQGRFSTIFFTIYYNFFSLKSSSDF